MAPVRARRNLTAFAAVQTDFVVNAAGGCGAALKESALWFKNDPALAETARQFSAQVQDLSQLLVELGSPVLGGRRGPGTKGCRY